MTEQSNLNADSFPVIQLWEDILVTPIVGEMDPNRSESLMEKLLEKTNKTGARVVVMDLSGVATMDTQVSKQLIDLGEAVRLMGARYIVCGIHSEQVQSMVKLGIDMSNIDTCQNLNSALETALDHLGMEVRHREEA